jgi:hypothetical protein
MNRGPLALFVSIVAVGLGPALWLGVQFGAVEIAPVRQQPVVSEQQPGGHELLGGAGAGSATNVDGESVIRTTPRSDTRPVTKTPKRTLSSSPSAADPEPTSSPSETTDPGDDPAPTGTEPTGEPTGPTDDPGDPPVPPAPPPVITTGPTTPADDGGIGAGERTAGA